MRLVKIVAGLLLLACGDHVNAAEKRMALSALEFSEVQLRFAQAKITYLGLQTKPIATVVFHSTGRKPIMRDFAKLYRGGELYTNDELPYTRFFGVSPYAFSEILRLLRTILSDPDTAKGPDFLSFTVLRYQQGNVEGEEFKIGSSAGRNFYRSLLTAIGTDNQLGFQIVEKQFLDVFPQEQSGGLGN